MEIALIIRPSGTLTPDQFQKIEEQAARLKIKPDQFVLDAILAKLEAGEKEAA